MASYLTGMKQPNGALNVAVDNTPEDDFDNPRVETLWKLLKRTRGFRTGSDVDLLASTSAANGAEPCNLQDAVGTFDDAAFPTYVDGNGDGFPDDPDPSVKLVIEDGGRPTYSQDYLTNFQPLEPATRESSALPNPKRDPDGLLLTGNMATRNVVGGANETEDNVRVAPHSADDVPLSASGPGDALFAGAYENADVHPRLAAALSGATRRQELEQEDRASDAVRPPGASLNGF